MLQIIIALLIVALLLWLVVTYLPRPFSVIVAVLICVLATLWTLRRLGMFEGLG